MAKRKVLVLLLLVLLAGCAGPTVKRTEPNAGQTRCLAFYDHADAVVKEAGAADAESFRIRGFPYLRADRYLAFMGQESLSAAEFDAWLDRMERLDREARSIEFNNLTPQDRRSLAPDAASFDRKALACAAVLRRYDHAHSSVYGSLPGQVRVPPSYSTAQRVFGLYPVTSAFMSAGVSRLHRKLRADFQQPLAELPVRGRLVRYGPAEGTEALSRDDVAAILERAADNPLGIPEPGGLDKRRLIHAFAPTWEVDVASRDDRIGAPAWRGDELLVDVDRPRVYTRISHTQFAGRTLLQLNYVVWFPARTREGRIDLLAGKLDGLTWRVTLAPDGTPLIYDTVHNCGCYHMFFPSGRLQRIPEADAGQEPLFVPQWLANASSARPVVRVAAGNHYVQRVHFDHQHRDVTYDLREYRVLRSLQAGAGRRSLFAANGLVPASERGERWLLWPSGVRSPGAMRQWGHHAVAFLGKRHFDDPDLMARYFRLKTEAANSAVKR